MSACTMPRVSNVCHCLFIIANSPAVTLEPMAKVQHLNHSALHIGLENVQTPWRPPFDNHCPMSRGIGPIDLFIARI